MRHRCDVRLEQEVAGQVGLDVQSLEGRNAVVTRSAEKFGRCNGNGNPVEMEREASPGRYFLRLSNRRIRQCLAALYDNDDRMTTETANAVLGK